MVDSAVLQVIPSGTFGAAHTADARSQTHMMAPPCSPAPSVVSRTVVEPRRYWGPQQSRRRSTTVGYMGRLRPPLLGICLAVVATGCSAHVTGAPSATTQTYDGPIDAELAITDSFDVQQPTGTCSGRAVFRGIADGARVETRGQHDFDFVTSTVATRYVENDFTRRPHDDGKFCVVTFRFTPRKIDGDGYWMQFPLATGGYGFLMQFKPNGLGKVTMTIQTCTDTDAPPDRQCGYG